MIPISRHMFTILESEEYFREEIILERKDGENNEGGSMKFFYSHDFIVSDDPLLFENIFFKI